jgi:hypothetical protein
MQEKHKKKVLEIFVFMALSVSVVSNDGGCHFLKKQHNKKNEKKTR